MIRHLASSYLRALIDETTALAFVIVEADRPRNRRAASSPAARRRLAALRALSSRLNLILVEALKTG